ncbi:MAG: hypothetical protein M0Z72_07195 [Deltaproteobacteria bacterium]|nr:hypothetical protein [Deltaproteobacteria bacterium]
MNKSDDFTDEHNGIIKKIGLLNRQEDFISFFFSIEYRKYITKLEESGDKIKMSEFEQVKNKKANELFKK